ncbi:hypothetical protein CI610_00100 [invertebrate metagenome]|uniref:AMMECR1 domain-containing protein n=1 Tax=invertebrate metagenome TaxID=1711999 RepID=A0A2H9TCG2_9ZZZZ
MHKKTTGTILMPNQQKQLLLQARNSIAYGLRHSHPPDINPNDWQDTFQQHQATFVTLEKQQQLRGCIGSLLPRQALIADITHNAFASAFHDPRFPAVSTDELPELIIKISVLGAITPIAAKSEHHLIQQLLPRTDGVIIKNATYHGTFLPQVWDQLPDPTQFLLHLKRKAGIQDNQWPDDMQCFRYHCQTFCDGNPLLE